MSKVGLVTVLFKSDDVLEGFLRSISKQEFHNYHLYLIDNSPSEQTDQLLKILFKKYPVSSYSHIRNNINTGAAAGNNQGIVLSLADKCRYTILLNNDIEFSNQNLIKELVYYAEVKNESIIVPKILFHNSKKIWMAGGRMITHMVVTDHIGYNQDDSPKYNSAKYITYAPTTFMLINNNVFYKVGLIDEIFFAYYEDTDFVLRACKKGFSIYYIPYLQVFHKVSHCTGGSKSNFSIYYLNRNRLIFWRKHYNNYQKIYSIPFLIYSIIYQFYKCDNINKKMFLKGILDGIKVKFT